MSHAEILSDEIVVSVEEKMFDSMKFVLFDTHFMTEWKKNRLICYQSRTNTPKNERTFDMLPSSFEARNGFGNFYYSSIFETHHDHIIFEQKQFRDLICFWRVNRMFFFVAKKVISFFYRIAQGILYLSFGFIEQTHFIFSSSNDLYQIFSSYKYRIICWTHTAHTIFLIN